MLWHFWSNRWRSVIFDTSPTSSGIGKEINRNYPGKHLNVPIIFHTRKVWLSLLKPWEVRFCLNWRKNSYFVGSFKSLYPVLAAKVAFFVGWFRPSLVGGRPSIYILFDFSLAHKIIVTLANHLLEFWDPLPQLASSLFLTKSQTTLFCNSLAWNLVNDLLGLSVDSS